MKVFLNSKIIVTLKENKHVCFLLDKIIIYFLPLIVNHLIILFGEIMYFSPSIFKYILLLVEGAVSITAHSLVGKETLRLDSVMTKEDCISSLTNEEQLLN